MRYTAKVIPGRGEGRKIGFPTINVEVPAGFLAQPGVYAGWAWTEPALAGANADAGASASADPKPAAIHYGPAPTFDVAQTSLEIHVIGMNVSYVPAEIGFEMVEYLREVRDFGSAAALVEQIKKDVQNAARILGNMAKTTK